MRNIVNQRWRTPEAIAQAQQELGYTMRALNEIGQTTRIAVFMGSARSKNGDPLYDHAYETAYQLGRDGFAILTGGGTGVMQAANSGAKDAGAISIGITSSLLPAEQVPSTLHDERIALAMFFNRRFALLTAADAAIVYEGGIGTLNEMSELMMLLQNDIVEPIPLYLVQSREKLLKCLSLPGQWDLLRMFMRLTMLKQRYINKGDERIGQIVNIDELSGDDLAKIIVEKVKIDQHTA